MSDNFVTELESQRNSFLSSRPESLAVRRDRLKRLERLILSGKHDLTTAMNADFGCRSSEMSLLVDVLPALNLVRHCLKNLKRWSKTERRRVMFPLGLIGARGEVRHEPMGVIGIVSPWNYPVGLSLAPLAQALAAGNRVMLKPSEFTPETSEMLARLVTQHFAPEEVVVVTGGPEVGEAFCTLPFDHLLFTGATSIGRKVMAAAAPNLTPVTLELGGKSPVIVSRSANLARTAERIVIGKLMNAGQTCVAPDYLLVPEEQVERLLCELQSATAAMYPTLAANPDYTAIINARHRDRLQALITDAVGKGACAKEVNPAGEEFADANATKLPLTLLTSVDSSMEVMREEIFGPILPVIGYKNVDEAIDYINEGNRPLALYWFGNDRAERETVLTRTISGGVTVNDCVFHVSMDDLPFGGVGPSGMGAYHGIEGFRTFSHARAVYHQPRWPVAALGGLKPPYGASAKRFLRLKLGK